MLRLPVLPPRKVLYSLVHSLNLRGIREFLIIEYPVHNRRSFALRIEASLRCTRGSCSQPAVGDERRLNSLKQYRVKAAGEKRV